MPPATLLVEPFGQITQVKAPIDEYVPALQLIQALASVAPVTVEYLPAAQSVQASDPVAILYFPATQAVQVPPSSPVYPRLQRQAEMAVCPVANVTAFVGQAAHVEANVAPTAAEYVLRPQSVHAADPVPSLNFPATGQEAATTWRD